MKMIVGSMSCIIRPSFLASSLELTQRMTCSPISESEDFPWGNLDRTSAENQDAHIAAACVDATFGFI
jgi:hypothetical protein